MTLTLDSNINPVFFEKDTYLIKTLEKAYEEIMGEARLNNQPQDWRTNRSGSKYTGS